MRNYKHTGGYPGEETVNKTIALLKYLSNILIPLIIIILFTITFFIHVVHIKNFFISRWNKFTSTIKTDSPYNESLNISHCNINNSGSMVYNDMIFNLFVIFTILLILFWYNYIIGLFSKTSLSNEIKILGYDKYYNSKLTNKNEYSIVNMLSIYIFITFIYYGYMIYESYMGTNYNEIEIYKNIKLIDQTIEDNMNCDLYNKLTSDDNKGVEINKKLKDFFEKNESIVGKKANTGSIEQRLKIVITFVLATDLSFVKINQENNICSKSSDTDTYNYNLKCLYRRLYNVKNNKILPDYNDISLINVIANPTYLVNLGDASIITDSLNINEAELKTAYEKIQSDIVKYSREITKNINNDIFYYKIGLVFATISAMLFSAIAIIYFSMFEFESLNKYANAGVYFGIDYYMKEFSTFISVYVLVLIAILVAFIINF
jgi:hypothetical protein